MKIVPTVAFLSLIALGGTLVFTNPDEQQYAKHLSQNLTVETQASLCQPESFSEWLGKVGEALSDACAGLIAGSKKLSEEEVQEIIIENTDYTNRVVFSTYITETPFGDYRSIGVLGNFFTKQTDEPAG